MFELLNVLFPTTSLFQPTRKRMLLRITNLLDLDIGARGVPLVLVQHPAPLEKVDTLGTDRDLEASTAGTTILVLSRVAVLVGQAGNGVLEQLLLGDILSVAGLGQVDLDHIVGLVLLGMVLGGPADTESVTDRGDGHTTVLAAVGLRRRVGTGLIRTGLGTGLAVRAGQGRVGVLMDLLVVAVRPGRVEGAEGLVEGEATGVTGALAALVGPVLLTALLELPVDAVSPGVGLSLGGVGGEDGQGGDDEEGEGSLENHDDSLCRVKRRR